MESDQEVVYRTNEDSHVVMSEKVQSLAGSIYQEFEKMISKYDHDVVKDLMPLVVNVLECLDMSYTENQEHEVELELLREDNEQLVTQYEREKQLRKNTEQKLLEVEDAVEDERKDLSCKIESLESIVRMLELKAKNSSDHVFRLEEKESEMKKEYAKLHERYTELFKTHVDYMERTKLLMSTNERLDAPMNRSSRLPNVGIAQLNRSSGPISFGFQSLEEVKDFNSPEDLIPGSPPDSTNSNTSLRNELNETQDINPDESTSETGKPSDKNLWLNLSNQNSKDNSPEAELPDDGPSSIVMTPIGRSTTKREQRSGNTLYQELSFQDAEALGDADDSGEITGSWVHPGEYASSANDNFFGMGKEVENLIMENNELLATKNALNIVKDDLIVKVDELTSEQEILREEMKTLQAVKNRLKQRVADLEEELKKVKEEAAKQAKGDKTDDEDEDVPMAQRKRFTRVEMARVLMERNQYKERFMELQEAVRWTEMIRASRSDISMDNKKDRQTIWKYFSNLFTISSSREKELPSTRKPPMNILYGPPNYHATPALAPVRENLPIEKKRGVDYMDRGNVSSEKFAQRRAIERKEQYRQVRAHVRKEDGRLQAYGWSLPAKIPPIPVPETGSRSQVPVPVPVYCQPLAANDPAMKIWCAAGVNLSGGRTKDGGSIVGASVFYSKPSTPPEEAEESAENDAEPHITLLEEELKEGKKVREEGETLEQRLSSLVWICSSRRDESRVTVIDANNPADVLESFTVCASYLLCIASVPGATEADYREENETNNNLVKETNWKDESTKSEDGGDNDENCNLGRISLVESVNVETEEEAKPETENDGFIQLEKMSSVMPTMWLGAQNGVLYVHSAVGQWSKSIHSVKMQDSVLCIVHSCGRVLVALANGSVAIFRRGPDAQWDMSYYHTVDLGGPHFSVRCMSVVHGTVWCGYKNKIHVLDPVSLVLKKSLEAHPRKESQVRQLAWLGDGVWVSIRLDSTLRLYHAHTYQHLQDVDIEPYVSKMLGTGKLGFSFVRITALLVSTQRLWIGTGNGVIISVPLSENAGALVSPGSVVRGPGAVVRVYTDSTSDKILPGSFIPYCSMAQAQLSFHGHRESVKFFIAVPGSKPGATNPNMLVMSGGEGYIDFRVGDGSDDDGRHIKDEDINEDEYENETARKGDLSHLIIWQVALPT